MARTPALRSRAARVLAIVVLVSLVAAAAATRAFADARAIDFEGPSYVAGSIDGQQGWGGQNPPGIAINGAIDQEVSSALPHGGLQSFRESSFFTSGSFGDQIFSPSLTDRAGETGSVADGMAGGTLQQHFTATLWFRSALPTAQNSHVVISPDRGDGARMSWVQVSDSTTLPDDGTSGLSVSFFDYVSPVPDDFVFHVVASNLSRSAWHRIDIEMSFYDGPENDIVRVSVDGGAATVGTSWEDYYRNQEGNPTRPVDALLFRVSGDAEGASGGGFYFDDVSYASGPCVPATRFVRIGGSDALNDCSDSGASCATVQHAVDVACLGDTIDVGPGTFTEQVTIAKSVTVGGAGATQTHIVAPATLPCSGSIVTAQGLGNTVEIHDLEVTGPGPNSCGCAGIRAGIEVKAAATGHVHDDTISLIRSADQAGLGGCQHGVGILVGGSGGDASATITHNQIKTYQKNGIVVSGATSAAQVTANTVDGGGATTLIARNGIQVSFGAVANVVGNTVSNHLCNNAACGADPVNDSQSAGILLVDQGASTTVTGNSVSSNDIGIYNYTTDAGNVQISNNQLAANRYEGIFLDQGTANLTDNTINGGAYGVIAVSFGGGAATGNSVGTLSCNRILGAGIGIGLIDDDPSGDAFIPVVTANSNQIAGNGIGVKNTTTTTMNAKSNYWGHGSGPNPPGAGDPIVGPVNATPFLVGLPACISCTTNADCANGLACDGAEVCNAGSCQGGPPVNCGTPGFCEVSVACQEPTGSCVGVAKPDGLLCSDGVACTVDDTCQAGVCQPGPGNDADHDGDCDDAEVACGCNPNDGSEICVLSNRLVGLPGSGAAEVLLSWYVPTSRRVIVETDPSCRTAGTGLCVSGRCTAGKQRDLCSSDADCYEGLNKCRVIVNYADVPEHKMYFARFGKVDAPGFVAGIPTTNTPIAVAAGCSKKVDVLVPFQQKNNNLRVKVRGKVEGRVRSDVDAIQYRR